MTVDVRAGDREIGALTAEEPVGPRVLAAIVVPPHMSVSGGARAGEQLSAALAPHCRMSVASMMNGAGAGTAGAAGESMVRRIPVRASRRPVLPWSRIPSRYGTLFYRSDIPQAIASEEYDLVHLHNPMPALELERVARACRAAGVPYVISTHGFNEVANGTRIYGFGGLKRAMWRLLVEGPVARAVRGASAIFALSEADKPIVREMGFRGQIDIVSNGVPLPAPADPVADQAALRRLGVEDASGPSGGSGLRCLFLANHTPNKGLPVLLEAFGRVELPFTLVIGGEKRDGVDYARFVNGVRPGQRIVVTGRLADADVGSLFRWAQLFVFPTLADTFPLVVLEAMSHGVPVVASAVGGIPHQLDQGCGMLVPPGDPAALAASVAALAADPAMLRAMASRSRARIEADYSWDVAALRARDAYQRILTEAATPAKIASGSIQ